MEKHLLAWHNKAKQKQYKEREIFEISRSLFIETAYSDICSHFFHEIFDVKFRKTKKMPIFAPDFKRQQHAKIAQLVEHNLAKVGVAGSSPVFRSQEARVVESVDTPDLKSCGHFGRAGSSPASSTKNTL